jgi:hypothetical protein
MTTPNTTTAELTALTLRSDINRLANELRRQEALGYSTKETRGIRGEIVRLEGLLSAV